MSFRSQTIGSPVTRVNTGSQQSFDTLEKAQEAINKGKFPALTCGTLVEDGSWVANFEGYAARVKDLPAVDGAMPIINMAIGNMFLYKTLQSAQTPVDMDVSSGQSLDNKNTYGGLDSAYTPAVFSLEAAELEAPPLST